MASTSKISKTSNEINGEDKLSELPDEILLQILTYLPFVDAVRTLIIRRFGNLWTLVPSLNFDATEIFPTEEMRWGNINYKDYIARFACFVRNVLILHKKSPIDKFQLRFYCIDMNDDEFKSFENEVSSWITFAIDRGVKELAVRFENHFDGFILPNCVFTSQSLVELDLVGHDIKQIGEVHMGSLRKLSLIGLESNNEVVKKLISGCPCLQELEILLVFGLNELQLNASKIEKLDLCYYHGSLDCPNLKILNIRAYDCYRSKFIRLNNVPSVREVNIIGFGGDLSTFVEFVREFRNVQVFEFSVEDCKASHLKEVDFPKTTWKRLHIMSQLHANALLAICNVVRSCEKLEELIIYTNSKHDLGIIYDHDMLSRAFAFPCLMDQLKTVTMCGYEASSQGLLLLAKYLLKSSVILETLIIYPSENQVDGLEEFMFVKQLKSFPRASSVARIIFGLEVY